MRALAAALRSLLVSIVRIIDVEGFLILGGIGLLAWLLRDVHIAGVSAGGLVVVLTLIVIGIAFARVPTSRGPT